MRVNSAGADDSPTRTDPKSHDAGEMVSAGDSAWETGTWARISPVTVAATGAAVMNRADTSDPAIARVTIETHRNECIPSKTSRRQARRARDRARQSTARGTGVPLMERVAHPIWGGWLRTRNESPDPG